MKKDFDKCLECGRVFYMTKYFRKNGQPVVKLHTVNVLEFANNEFQQSFSFADNPQGNKRAERKFRRLVVEHEKDVHNVEWMKEDIDNMVEDGIFDDQSGYQVLLTHSL